MAKTRPRREKTQRRRLTPEERAECDRLTAEILRNTAHLLRVQAIKQAEADARKAARLLEEGGDEAVQPWSSFRASPE